MSFDEKLPSGPLDWHFISVRVRRPQQINDFVDVAEVKIDRVDRNKLDEKNSEALASRQRQRWSIVAGSLHD